MPRKAMRRAFSATQCAAHVALFIVAALVLVPTVLRATHYSVQGPTVRLSVRLNWKGDKPQAKPRVPRPDRILARAVLVVPKPEPLRWTIDRADTPDGASDLPLDNSPDTPRGPPALSLL